MVRSPPAEAEHHPFVIRGELDCCPKYYHQAPLNQAGGWGAIQNSQKVGISGDAGDIGRSTGGRIRLLRRHLLMRSLPRGREML